MYGGAALNAAHAMVKTLDGLVAHDGTLAEALRKGIAPPTEEELAGWAQLPTGADELAEQGARPKDPAAARDFYRRTFAEPAVDVNGIFTGEPRLQKTVLPVEAIANVSIRLAPGPDRSTRSRLRWSASCASRRPTAPTSTSTCGRRRRPGSCRRTRRPCSSASTPSSACSAVVRR